MSRSPQTKADAPRAAAVKPQDASLRAVRQGAAAQGKPNPATADASDDTAAAAQEAQATQVERYKSTLQHMRSLGDDRQVTTRLLGQALQQLAPQDAQLLREALGAGKVPRYNGAAQAPDPDLERSHAPIAGTYPYRNRMSTQNYEAQQYRLQVELNAALALGTLRLARGAGNAWLCGAGTRNGRRRHD
jgi:hypothetical protein